MIRILLVEDEKSISDLIKINLEIEGYEVVAVADGKKASETFKAERFDLVILDVMLPSMNGIEVCEQIRLTNHTIPILILSARSEADDRINGLKKGADDYLTKPFVLEELLLRIQKLLQRSIEELKSDMEEYSFDSNHINFTTYEATGPKGKFKLTKKEVMLIRLFLERKNQVVSRKDILQAVWGYDVIPSTRTIDNFILMLRKNFEKNPSAPTHFISVRGVGYKFVE